MTDKIVLPPLPEGTRLGWYATAKGPEPCVVVLGTEKFVEGPYIKKLDAIGAAPGGDLFGDGASYQYIWTIDLFSSILSDHGTIYDTEETAFSASYCAADALIDAAGQKVEEAIAEQAEAVSNAHGLKALKAGARYELPASTPPDT